MLTVLLYGNTSAAYRPSCFADFFLKRPKEFSVILATGGAYSSVWRPLRVIMRCWLLLQCVIGSNIVIIQPMNHASPYSRWILWCARLLRRKAVVDFYISYFETQVIDRKIHAPGSRAAKRLARRDIGALASSDLAIFLNASERDYYHEALGRQIDSSKCAIIPLVVPTRGVALTPWFRGMATQPTIAWWGREGNPLHGFDCIAAAIRKLLGAGFGGRFALFPAGGEAWEAFAAEFKDIFNHPQVFISTEYTFANGRLDEFLLSSTDVALGTFGATRKAKTVIVNKVLDAASYGIPCITQRSSGLMEYFEEGESVILCEPTPDKLADSIATTLSEIDDAIRIAGNAKAVVQANFSGARFESMLAEVVSRIRKG